MLYLRITGGEILVECFPQKIKPINIFGASLTAFPVNDGILKKEKCSNKRVLTTRSFCAIIMPRGENNEDSTTNCPRVASTNE